MGAPRHELVDEIESAVEQTEPTRVNFNAALLEVLDAYIRCRLMHQSFDPSPVFVTDRVYQLAHRGGLLRMLEQRFPKVEILPKSSTVRGMHPTHVIFDEVAGFEQ